MRQRSQNRRLLQAALSLLLLCTASRARAAGLAWARTSIEVSAQPGQSIVLFDFPFQNRGDRAITLVSVEASCRCLAADVSRKTYGPGEKGDVHVAFSLGSAVGLQEKSVTIETNMPNDVPVRLLLRVNVPRTHP